MSDLFGGVARFDDGMRSEFDFYETPAFMTRSLLHHTPQLRKALVLECCSGRDAITQVLRAEGSCRVFTNDIDTRHPAQMHEDATEAEFWTHAPYVEWVVTNPPFDLAFPILKHALGHAQVGVILLLRKTFLEPTHERGPWLEAFPPARLLGEPRYQFRGKGSDSVSCDWMFWTHAPIAEWTRPILIDYTADARKSL